MMQKKPIKIWDVHVDYIVISKLVETKNNSKHLIGYLDKVIRPLVLILPKTSEYAKAFKDKEKSKNNKLMALRIDDDKLLAKYKTICTMIEDLKRKKELNALPVYDDRHIKTKIKTYGDKVYIIVKRLIQK